MTGNAEQLIQWLFNQSRDKLFDIKEHREKRSLNANAYCWALITKIAEAMRPPLKKEDVYVEMLKSYGQSELVSIVSDVKIDGYFKYYEKVGQSYLNGKNFTHYRIFKGSSEYDTKEMSLLIDGIVQEAKNLGIETMTPAEVERLKGMWK